MSKMSKTDFLKMLREAEKDKFDNIYGQWLNVIFNSKFDPCILGKMNVLLSIFIVLFISFSTNHKTL
jgi:hypothetical protein